MRRTLLLLAVVSTVALAACGGESDSSQSAGSGDSAPAKVRASWLNTVATLGQYAEVMQKTDVMDKYDIDATFSAFPSAAEMATAAAAGQIDQYIGSDIGLTGILARGEEWTIVAGSIGWRFGFAVAEDSPVTDLADLKGKKVGVPFGVSTQVYLQRALEDAGLEPGKDVELVNVPIPQIASALESEAVAAVGGWDPALGSIPDSRVVYSDVAGTGKPYPSTVIAFPTKFVEERRDVVVNFLAATIQSMWYAIEHPDETAEWFSATSKIPVPVLNATLEHEPLWGAKSIDDINIELTQGAIDQMDANAEFFAEQKLIPKAVSLGDHWDDSLAVDAQELVREQGPLELTVTR